MASPSALYRRTTTGRGGRVDTSLLMSAMILQNNLMIRVDDGDARNHADYLAWLAEARAAAMPYAEQAGRMPAAAPRAWSASTTAPSPRRTPPSLLPAPAPGCAGRLLAVLGLDDPGLAPNLPEDERHAHDRELQDQFEALFASETTDHWEGLLRDSGIPVSRVRFPTELIDNEQAAANDLFIHADHPEAGPFSVLGSALKLDDDGFAPAAFPAPFRSETRDILAWAGLSPDAIKDAIASGAVVADSPGRRVAPAPPSGSAPTPSRGR